MPIVKYGKSKPKENKVATVAENKKPNPDSAVFKKMKAAVNKGKKG